MAVALAALALAACGGGEAGSGGKSAASPSPGSRVVFLMLENHGFSQVLDGGEMPFLSDLAQRGALATSYRAITHPSLPNYLALVGGSTFGIESDCTDCAARGSNLGVQLSRAGISWRAYMEDMPDACSEATSAGGYAKRHNPFMYFDSVTDDPSVCRNVVPGDELEADLRAGRLPSFAWITPNLCHDGHDCGLDAADRYLSDLVPQLLPQLGPQGFLVIDFDEDGNEDAPAGSDGGRVPVVLAGPVVRHGARVAAPYDHYSMLRTLEDVFGLKPLRRAASAQPMTAAFSRMPRLP